VICRVSIACARVYPGSEAQTAFPSVITPRQAREASSGAPSPRFVSLDIERGAPWFNRDGECDEAPRRDRDQAQALGMDTDTKWGSQQSFPDLARRRGAPATGETTSPAPSWSPTSRTSTWQRPKRNAQRLTAEYSGKRRRALGGMGHGPICYSPRLAGSRWSYWSGYWSAPRARGDGLGYGAVLARWALPGVPRRACRDVYGRRGTVQGNLTMAVTINREPGNIGASRRQARGHWRIVRSFLRSRHVNSHAIPPRSWLTNIPYADSRTGDLADPRFALSAAETTAHAGRLAVAIRRVWPPPSGQR
jgi:hypothetical protein